MTHDVYHKPANALETLPNGFPATKNGIEVKILKKIFTPGEAGLFCDLRLTPETAAQIAARTGRPFYSSIDFAEGCLIISKNHDVGS